ncbi:MAG TPA: NusG domain II-containing protein [Halanaerobiales bacterium]|nr:NusG domain II-containing protein [Halanaerobiales bacterium]
MEKITRYLTVYDKILIIVIIVISLIMIAYPFISAYFSNNEEQNSFIYIKDSSKEVKRIPFSETYQEEPMIIKVEGPLGTSIIEAHNGRVRLKEAPEEDPAKICEKTGWISKPGPSIICVPNKVSIWIEQTNSDLDAVSW